MRIAFAIMVCVLLAAQTAAQNRGVYPLGMSATNSGLTPPAGFTYVNQLLYYSRDHAKDDAGERLPVTGDNSVLMDMNTIAWVSERKLPGDVIFSMVGTVPIAKNNLASDIKGDISGGSGLADSYWLPLVFAWNRESFSIRAMYGFLAPTGRYDSEASDNVGSGYWTHTISSGQTFFLSADKGLALSAFEMYEFHTKQEGTGTHPGDTFDFDYSLMKSFAGSRWQAGVAGYNARQISETYGPAISASQSADRYAVNALGFAISTAFPKQKASVTFKYFNEFSNRSTFEGYSVQLSGSIGF